MSAHVAERTAKLAAGGVDARDAWPSTCQGTLRSTVRGGMRSDMSKIIVERPRRRIPKRNGSWYPRGRLKARWHPDLEDAPSREGMGHLYRDKWLNENLQPLVRFLRTNVGRPWAAVYADVAAHVRPTSAVQKHVLDHLRQYVEEHPRMIDGVACHPMADPRGASRPITSVGMRFRFFVCPRTGILRLGPLVARKRKIAPPDPDRRVLSSTRELRLIAGIWFDVELAGCGCAVHAAVVERPILRKRQLGSREIARHGLRSNQLVERDTCRATHARRPNRVA